MADRDAAVREYVSRVMPDCSTGRIRAVDILVPGENHAIYKVSYLDLRGDVNHLVVRVGSPESGGRLRAEREAKVLAKVGGVAGPKLYDFSADVAGLDGTVMCLEFLPGDQPDLAEAGPGDIGRLGRLVQWLHAQPVDDFTDWASPGTGLSAYVQERWRDHLESRLGAIRQPLSAPLQERLRGGGRCGSGRGGRAEGSRHGRWWRPTGAPSRRHLGRQRGVDPRAGADRLGVRLGDPADEVAYLFTQNALSHPQRDAFWRGYCEGPAAAEVPTIAERVRYWELITLLGSVLWWLDAWSRADAASAAGQADPSLPRQPGYYLEQAVRRQDRFQSN